MDYNEIPDILKNASMDDSSPWTLKRMGELLQVSYQLLDHPVLKNWRGCELIDTFRDAMENLDEFKRYNRTIVERTISQAAWFSQIESNHGILTMKSKGIEFSILCLESFLSCANEILSYSDDESVVKGVSIRIFKLHSAGEIKAAMNYFMDICNEMIVLIQKHHIQNAVNKIEKDEDKIKHLLKQKAVLLQQKDQFNEKVFSSVMEVIQVELDYHKEIQAYLEISAELKALIEQFLLERNSRISNQKLLLFLLEGKINEFCDALSELVMQLFSYHDIGGNEAEKVYHAFLIGIFNSFKEDYRLESNKEAGRGRFDILLIPNTLQYKGLIIEVKRSSSTNKNTINNFLDEALNQIIENEYAIQLKMLGHQQCILLAAVFHGKDLFLKHKIISIC